MAELEEFSLQLELEKKEIYHDLPSHMKLFLGCHMSVFHGKCHKVAKNTTKPCTNSNLSRGQTLTTFLYKP